MSIIDTSIAWECQGITVISKHGKRALNVTTARTNRCFQSVLNIATATFNELQSKTLPFVRALFAPRKHIDFRVWHDLSTDGTNEPRKMTNH